MTIEQKATMTGATIFHGHGGTIDRVVAVGHATHAGVATWHYVCDVTWNDGKQSLNAIVEPYALCHDGTNASRARIVVLSDLLNRYLQDVGAWHEPKRKRDGRVVHWTPQEPEGRRSLL